MATYYSVGSGDWSNSAIWSLSSGGSGGAGVPTTGDTVRIDADYIIDLVADTTVTYLVHSAGRLNLSGFKITITGGNGYICLSGAVLDMSNSEMETYGFSLNSTGTMIATGSHLTVNHDGSGLHNLGAGTYHDVTINTNYRTTNYFPYNINSGSTFNDVRVNMGTTNPDAATLYIAGSPTFRTLDIRSVNSAAHTVNFGGDVTILGKFIAIGSNSSNRLTLGDGSVKNILFGFEGGERNQTSYGQFVNAQIFASGNPTQKYIGSNSVQQSGRGWLLENPPKIFTFTDDFTSSSASLPTKWNMDSGGTGYFTLFENQLFMGWSTNSSSYISIFTADSYDLVDSVIYTEVNTVSGSPFFTSIRPVFGDDWSIEMPVDEPSVYRFRGVSSGSDVIIYAEKGDYETWTTISTTTVEAEYARSVRFGFTGNRNLSSAYIAVDNVNVIPTPTQPVTNFSGSPTSGKRPLTVNFTDLTSGIPDAWSWNFGDSTGSSSQNPTKTYTNAGSYTVSLTASNEIGDDTETKTAYITVNPEVFSRSISGTILFSGSASRKILASRSISGTLRFGGSARAVVLRDVEGLQDKRYLYKVYDPDGTYIEVWKDVMSELNFTHEINTIGSTTYVELARNSDTVGVTISNLLTEDDQPILTEDDFNIQVATESRNQIGSGSSVDYNNRVDITVFYGSVEPLLTEDDEPILTEDDEEILADIGAPNGRRVFTGFISEINSRYGNTETTVVQLTSYGWDLDQFPITTSGGATTVAFNSYDPSDIAEEAIDKFRADSASFGTYTDRTITSIEESGTVVSYTFRANTYKEVLDKTLELMPSNWYYRVGLGDNIVYFSERSTTPRHLFYLGKHIKALDLKGSILDSTNRVLFTGGGDPALYINREEVPADRTRRTLEVMSDSRVTLTDSAQIISDGKIENNNKLLYRSTVEILSIQYDIESINVGDTVGFRNFGDQQVDGLIMQVVGLSYSPDSVQLQLETKPPTISKRLEDVRRNLTVSENTLIPDMPS